MAGATALSSFKSIDARTSDTGRRSRPSRRRRRRATRDFKDPYLVDFLGTADPRREHEVVRTIARNAVRRLPAEPDQRHREERRVREFSPHDATSEGVVRLSP